MLPSAMTLPQPLQSLVRMLTDRSGGKSTAKTGGTGRSVGRGEAGAVPDQEVGGRGVALDGRVVERGLVKACAAGRERGRERRVTHTRSAAYHSIDV